MADHMGHRIGRWRTIAGMTQQALADEVGISQSHLSQIENGKQVVDKRSLLIKLAGALRVSITDLTARPRPPRDRDDLAIEQAAATVRVALDAHPQGGDLPHPDELLTRARLLLPARAACDYPTLAVVLAGAVADARAILATTDSDHARTAARRALVTACAFGAFALKTDTYVDLAMRLAERARVTALALGDPVHLAVANYAMAQVSMTAGVRDHALTVALEGVDAVTGRPDADSLTWCGQLHMQAALCSASLGLRDDVAWHLDEAAATAAQVTGDPWRLDFSQANVDIWRMGVMLENGTPERAPEIGRKVNRGLIRTPQRMARLYMDIGRGWYAASKPTKAAQAFRAAIEVSAIEVRRRSAVREIVGQMARDVRVKSGSAELRDLCVKLGVDPFAPEDAYLA